MDTQCAASSLTILSVRISAQFTATDSSSHGFSNNIDFVPRWIVFLCLSQDPESYEDIRLSPYTNYSYWLITANVAGQTRSASVTYQTLAAPPEADQLHLSLVGRPGPTSASFNWSAPRNDTGPVER